MNRAQIEVPRLTAARHQSLHRLRRPLDLGLRVVDVQREFGSLDAYIWSFVDGTPTRNAFDAMSQIPPETDVSKTMSRDLKKRNFNFVGPTICYAFMQAVGMVNDHLTNCFRYDEV